MATGPPHLGGSDMWLSPHGVLSMPESKVPYPVVGLGQPLSSINPAHVLAAQSCPTL